MAALRPSPIYNFSLLIRCSMPARIKSRRPCPCNARVSRRSPVFFYPSFHYVYPVVVVAEWPRSPHDEQDQSQPSPLLLATTSCSCNVLLHVSIGPSTYFAEPLYFLPGTLLRGASLVFVETCIRSLGTEFLARNRGHGTGSIFLEYTNSRVAELVAMENRGFSFTRPACI